MRGMWRWRSFRLIVLRWPPRMIKTIRRQARRKLLVEWLRSFLVPFALKAQ